MINKSTQPLQSTPITTTKSNEGKKTITTQLTSQPPKVSPTTSTYPISILDREVTTPKPNKAKYIEDLRKILKELKASENLNFHHIISTVLSEKKNLSEDIQLLLVDLTKLYASKDLEHSFSIIRLSFSSYKELSNKAKSQLIDFCQSFEDHQDARIVMEAMDSLLHLSDFKNDADLRAFLPKLFKTTDFIDLLHLKSIIKNLCIKRTALPQGVQLLIFQIIQGTLTMRNKLGLITCCFLHQTPLAKQIKDYLLKECSNPKNHEKIKGFNSIAQNICHNNINLHPDIQLLLFNLMQSKLKKESKLRTITICFSTQTPLHKDIKNYLVKELSNPSNFKEGYEAKEAALALLDLREFDLLCKAVKNLYCLPESMLEILKHIFDVVETILDMSARSPSKALPPYVQKFLWGICHNPDHAKNLTAKLDIIKNRFLEYPYFVCIILGQNLYH